MSILAERYPRALITGAGSGLGKAFATLLMEHGVEVWGTSRNPAHFEPRDHFNPLQLDLTKEPAMPEWFERWEEASGGFDLVINNAGFAVLGPLESLTAVEIEDQIQVMLTAPIQLASRSIAAMRARKAGCLVNVSSVAGLMPVPFLSVYNAAKAGLSAFSQSLMMETPECPPWIIDFQPGDYDTAFNRNMKRHMGGTERMERVWDRMEELVSQSPPATKAAEDLLAALLQFRHCTCSSGSFVQTSIAMLARRLLSHSLQRKILRRYYRLP